MAELNSPNRYFLSPVWYTFSLPGRESPLEQLPPCHRTLQYGKPFFMGVSFGTPPSSPQNITPQLFAEFKRLHCSFRPIPSFTVGAPSHFRCVVNEMVPHAIMTTLWVSFVFRHVLRATISTIKSPTPPGNATGPLRWLPTLLTSTKSSPLPFRFTRFETHVPRLHLPAEFFGRNRISSTPSSFSNSVRDQTVFPPPPRIPFSMTRALERSGSSKALLS